MTDIIRGHGVGTSVDAGEVNSGASTDGQVLTSDGAQGAAWETPVSATERTANGSSSSGTPGTVIAEIEAAAGKTLVAWTARASTGGASSLARCVLTFSDDTTETLECPSASLTYFFNRSGRLPNSSDTLSRWLDQTKAVKKVSIQTSSTGVASRGGSVQAVEI